MAVGSRCRFRHCRPKRRVRESGTIRRVLAPASPQPREQHLLALRTSRHAPLLCLTGGQSHRLSSTPRRLHRSYAPPVTSCRASMLAARTFRPPFPPLPPAHAPLIDCSSLLASLCAHERPSPPPPPPPPHHHFTAAMTCTSSNILRHARLPAHPQQTPLPPAKPPFDAESGSPRLEPPTVDAAGIVNTVTR